MESEQPSSLPQLADAIPQGPRHLRHQRPLALRRYEVLNLLLALRGPDATLHQLQPLREAQAVVLHSRQRQREVREGGQAEGQPAVQERPKHPTRHRNHGLTGLPAATRCKY